MLGVAAVVAATGDSPREANPIASYTPQQPPDDHVRRVARRLGAADTTAKCGAVSRLTRQSLFRFRCPLPGKAREAVAGLKVVGSATYGPAAVVDYVSQDTPDGASAVLFATRQLRWALSRFGLLNEPSTESSDTDSRDEFDEAVDGYVSAVREGRCSQYDRYAVNAAEGDREAICADEFQKTVELGEALGKNPGAEPEYLGGNERFGFYSLTFAKPQSASVIVSVAKGSTGRAAVLNFAPGPVPR